MAFNQYGPEFPSLLDVSMTHRFLWRAKMTDGKALLRFRVEVPIMMLSTSLNVRSSATLVPEHCAFRVDRRQKWRSAHF